MKWNLLVFIKKKVFMYLFKTKEVCNVIYCQIFLRSFGNGSNTQHGKLLRFLWSSYLRSSIKKVFLNISQNSLENTWVGVSISINLHASVLQLYQKRRLRHRCFPLNSVNFSEHLFFQNTSEQLLLNFTNENKTSENEISNRWFYLFWSFIYKSYCIVTNIRRPANKFIKPC